MPTQAPQRRRGRPRASEASGSVLRQEIIEASKPVYAEHGFRDSSVQLMLRAAGVSRPTFYRHFKDRREVIDEIVRSANQSLLASVLEAVGSIRQPLAMVEAGVDAYFAWCADMGPLAGRIYSEIHDPASPASIYRQQSIDALVKLLHERARSLGHPTLEPLFYDTLIRAVEHLGSSGYFPVQQPPARLEQHRRIARRILLAALAAGSSGVEIPPLQSVALSPPASAG